MFTYLTWLPDELEGDRAAVPKELKHVRAVNARRPKEAAAKAALRANVTKHPHDVSVRVMRADRLNEWSPKVKKYWVRFGRDVEKVMTEQ